VAYRSVAKKWPCKHHRCWVMPAGNNRGGVIIRDAYSHCYVAPAAYACAVTSHNNRKSDAGGVLCGQLQNYTIRPTIFCWVQYSWRFSYWVLTSGQRKLKNLDSKGFWRWCITSRITGFLDFLHQPAF
jgi:hypothetical protein